MTQEDILNNPEKYDLSIETVGTGTLKSPMKGVPFVSESERVSLTADVGRIQDFCKRGIEIPSLEAAGPRETIFHDPAWTRAGIVTCGEEQYDDPDVIFRPILAFAREHRFVQKGTMWGSMLFVDCSGGVRHHYYDTYMQFE